MPRLDRFVLGLTLGLATTLAATARDETPSALERDPQGWTDLLADAGSDLKGWTRLPVHAEEKMNPESQWSLDPKSGFLVCQGDKGHDWLRWDKPLADFIYHVEWRFTPVEGKQGYNSGVYVRNSPDAKIWHQAQTGSGTGGFLFGDTLVNGQIKRINLADKLLDRRVKPAGDWNTYEIRCQGKDVTLWTNGSAVTNKWHDCEVPTGHVGLEAEGWRIEFRNVKVKPL